MGLLRLRHVEDYSGGIPLEVQNPEILFSCMDSRRVRVLSVFCRIPHDVCPSVKQGGQERFFKKHDDYWGIQCDLEKPFAITLQSYSPLVVFRSSSPPTLLSNGWLTSLVNNPYGTPLWVWDAMSPAICFEVEEWE